MCHIAYSLLGDRPHDTRQHLLIIRHSLWRRRNLFSDVSAPHLDHIEDSMRRIGPHCRLARNSQTPDISRPRIERPNQAVHRKANPRHAGCGAVARHGAITERAEVCSAAISLDRAAVHHAVAQHGIGRQAVAPAARDRVAVGPSSVEAGALQLLRSYCMYGELQIVFPLSAPTDRRPLSARLLFSGGERLSVDAVCRLFRTLILQNTIKQ